MTGWFSMVSLHVIVVRGVSDAPRVDVSEGVAAVVPAGVVLVWARGLCA